MNTTMKKSAVIVDSINETITITKAYYKKACSYGSSEYYEFRQIKSDNAGFAILFKTIEKKTYNGLTFAVMKAYIESQPNSEKQLKVFEAVKRIAEMKGSKYPLTKKWFLKNYPEFKMSDISAAETATLEEQLAAELDELVAEDDKVLNLADVVNK